WAWQSRVKGTSEEEAKIEVASPACQRPGLGFATPLRQKAPHLPKIASAMPSSFNDAPSNPGKGYKSCNDAIPRRQTMVTARQSRAARKNIKKAARVARRKKTIKHLPKKTRTALGKQGAKMARK